ncbi:MAG TPA: ComEC/Rec2 family competence protein [Candidatus Ornithoclostridium faecigallinarum]|nr:ComEC/Rec2 family competence protein [Candidatus Ornithoclostridium faecigallinarum]
MADKKAFKLFNLRVFPAALLGVICGICSYLLTDTAIVSAVTAIVPAAAIAVCILLKKKGAATFFICVTIGATLGILGSFANVKILEDRAFYGENIVVTARIGSGNAVELDGSVDGSDWLTIDNIVADGVKLEGKGSLLLRLANDGELKEGDVITFVAETFGTLSNYGDGFTATALAQGKYYQIYAVTIEGEPSFEIVGEKYDMFDKIRLAVADKLSANMREDTAEFVYAMLFGYKDVMNEGIQADFAASGTAHLLAVSGLHVVMLAATVNALFRKMRLPAWASFPLLVAVMFGFGAICGFAPSIVRSIVMIVILELGKIVGGRYDALSSLSLAAAATLIFSPYSLFALGFLMSYAAVYGIVLFNETIERGLVRIKCPKALAAALAVTISANIGVLPITVHTFGATSLVFLLANLMVVPLVSFAFPVFLVALAIAFIPYMGWVLSAVSLFFTAMILIVQACAGIRIATIEFELEWYIFVIYFALLIFISRYSFVQVQAKIILASVLIVGFSVLVVAQSAARWFYPERIICFGDQSYVGAVFVTDDGQAYIAADGDLSYAFLLEVTDILAKENVEKVTLAADEVDEYDMYAIEKLFRAYDGRLCTQSYVAPTAYVKATVESVADEDAAIYFDDGGVATIFRGVKTYVAMAAHEACPSAARAELVVSVAKYAPSTDEQTVVCDEAYFVFAQNSLPSDFTFGVNGGKIKKIAKWRFA